MASSLFSRLSFPPTFPFSSAPGTHRGAGFYGGRGEGERKEEKMCKRNSLSFSRLFGGEAAMAAFRKTASLVWRPGVELLRGQASIGVVLEEWIGKGEEFLG